MWNELSLMEKVFFERKSFREFSEKKVSSELQDILLKVGNAAPRSGGIPCITITPITSDKDKKMCYKASFYQKAVLSAPLIYVISGDLDMLGKKYKEPYLTSFIIQNAAVATMNMINACQLLNIETCYIGGIRSEMLQKYFEMNETTKIITLLAVGYKRSEEG